MNLDLYCIQWYYIDLLIIKPNTGKIVLCKIFVKLQSKLINEW